MHVEYRDYGPGGACDCPDRTDRAHGVCELVDLGADELLATQDGDTYVKASRVTETGRLHELTISTCTTGVTILGSALYTPDDWEQVLTLYRRGALQYPWFAGDTLP